MSYLLDTHTLLWCLDNNPKLSPIAKNIIKDSNNTIFISPINTWEIMLKHSHGKLKAPDNIEKLISDSGFKQLPINITHTLYLDKLVKHHSDPFDRLLVSQAILEELTIITRDKEIRKYPVLVVQA